MAEMENFKLAAPERLAVACAIFWIAEIQKAARAHAWIRVY
jgi:hypothetical protein